MRLSVYFFIVLLALSLSLEIQCQENTDTYLKVAIFGTGKKNGQPENYDQESLAKVLRRIKDENPDVVIFTGNLIQGLEQNTSTESLRNFEHNLKTFSKLVKNYLGEKIPLFPVMGNHTLVNSQAVAIFRDHFKIEDTAPLEDYQLAYSKVVNNVKFSILATGDFERKFRGYRYFTRSMPIFDWLEKDVRTGANEIDFHFVIGHMPAFSSETTAGLFTGNEKVTEKNDQFWNILKRNKVLGYFCSHELIYDRSNRNGVWQLISGGVGDPRKFTDEEHMFQHFVLLLIPRNRGENPIAKAIDINGKEWDQFKLMPIDRPVHHLRISNN